LIRKDASSFPTAAATHAGMSGKINEDRFAVSAYQLDDETPVVFAVLCDGIGGHRAGEVAAEIAVNMISDGVAKSDGSSPLQVLRMAIEAASNAIQAEARKDMEYSGMGATCAAAWLIGRRLYTASVGDSRIYLLRNGSIYQLNIDHTWIQEALDAGVLSPEEAVGHPNTHVIRRYLGSPQPPEVDLRLRLKEQDSGPESIANQGLPLETGDRVLLCSDGLTDLVNRDEIAALASNMAQESACQALVNLANERGGFDNITVVMVEMPVIKPTPSKTRTAEKAVPGKRSLATCGSLGLVVLLLAAALTGWLWLRGGERLATTSTPTVDLAVEGTLPVLPPTLLAQESATFLPPMETPTPAQTATLNLPSSTATLTPIPTGTITPTPTIRLTRTAPR